MPSLGWKRRWRRWQRRHRYGAFTATPVPPKPTGQRPVDTFTTTKPEPPKKVESPKWDYQALLRHPRWQEKRVRIIERDDGFCRVCGQRPPVVEVHHGYYQWGTNPWDYDDSSLSTLCRDCHENETRYADGQKATLIKALALKGALGQSYAALAKAIMRCRFQASPEEVCAAMAWSVYDKRSQKAMLKRYRKAKLRKWN